MTVCWEYDDETEHNIVYMDERGWVAFEWNPGNTVTTLARVSSTVELQHSLGQ